MNPSVEHEFLAKIQAFYGTLRPTTALTVTDGWSPVTLNRLRKVQADYPEIRLLTGLDQLKSSETMGFNIVGLDPREFYYAVPCTSLSGRLLGIYFRAVQKEVRSHYVLVDEGLTRNMPFGFFTRPAWAAKKYDDPIWVCEGVFDALALQEVHPYVVAAFGGSMTWGKIQTIAALAKRVVCYFDNDAKGKAFFESFERIVKSSQRGVSVVQGRLGSSEKDPGSYLDKGKASNLKVLAAWNDIKR